MRPLLVVVLAVALTGCASTPRQVDSTSPEINPRDPMAATILMQQGQALLADGKAEAALAKHRAALKLQPNNPTAHNMVGLALLQLGDGAAALKSFSNALTLAPSYSDARNNRGVAYLRLGQSSLAEADFLAVLGDRTYANRAGVLYNLGSLYFARGNLASAEENLKRAAVPSGPLEAYLLYAQIEERLGRPEIAESAYHEAMARAPERADVPMALGKLLESLGRVEEARQLYRRVISLAPNSPEAAEARGRLGG